MKSIDVLFQRADLNRAKYIKALGEIGEVARSKVAGCHTVICSWECPKGYKLLFCTDIGNVTVDAKDFFDRFSGCRNITFKELLKYSE